MFSRLPDRVASKIRETIVKDLSPSRWLVHLKLCLAVGVGGLVSLTICGQFGMGATGWAEALSHRIHESMSPLLCASICGILFAIFPTLILRLVLCSPLQLRVILKLHLPAVSLWYASAGVTLATYGQHGQGFGEILFWSISAILTSYFLAKIMRPLIPLWNFPKYIDQLIR